MMRDTPSPSSGSADRISPDQPASLPSGHSACQSRWRSIAITRLTLTVREPSGTVIKRKISPRLLATRMAVTMGDT